MKRKEISVRCADNNLFKIVHAVKIGIYDVNQHISDKIRKDAIRAEFDFLYKLTSAP